MVADGVTAVCAQSEETGFIVLQDIWDANLHCPDDLAVIASSPTRCRERSACGCGTPVPPAAVGHRERPTGRSAARLCDVAAAQGGAPIDLNQSRYAVGEMRRVTNTQRTRTAKRKTCHADGGAVGVWSATHFRGVVILSLHPIVLSDVRRGVVHPLRRSRGCAEGGAGNRLTRDARTDNCVGRGHRAQGAIPATADSPSEKLIAKAANGPARHR